MEWIFEAWSYVTSNGKGILWSVITVGLIAVLPTWLLNNEGSNRDRDYGPIDQNEGEMTVAERVIAYRIADQTNLLRTNTMWLQAIYMVIVFLGLGIGRAFFLDD
jgi:hypothetical protein